jgi:hypothetical protein
LLATLKQDLGRILRRQKPALTEYHGVKSLCPGTQGRGVTRLGVPDAVSPEQAF